MVKISKHLKTCIGYDIEKPKSYMNEQKKEQKNLLLIDGLFIENYSSRSKRANFLSTQIVAKGKKAESKAKTVSSSSHL